MTKYKVRNLKPALIFGFGFWRDKYNYKNHGFDGWTYNVIIPFLKIQFGEIYLNN